MDEPVFSASFLQSSVSHDPSEFILICWFAAQELIFIFVETVTHFFSGFFEYKVKKEQHLLKKYIL